MTFFLHLWLCSTYILVALGGLQGIRYCASGVTDSFELPCGC